MEAMYTIAAHFHLHTESGEQLLEGGGTAITPKLTHQWLADHGDTCV